MSPDATPTAAPPATETPRPALSPTASSTTVVSAPATATPAPATPTRVPASATATLRPVPATATSTPRPATATPTPVPPTPVLPAICLASQGRLSLYAGPARTYVTVVVLGVNEEVRPLARTQDATWLQVVTLDGIQGWFPYDLARCQNLDLSKLIVVIAPTPIPVPPTATPTPVQPTATATATPVTITDWKGEYFANPNLVGAPVLVRNDVTIGFDWGTGSPTAQVPVDSFSARWTRSVYFAAGVYRFNLRVDDGARLFIDDALAIDMWQPGVPRTRSADIPLASGAHSLRVEYFESTGGATCTFWWEIGPIGNWRGEYYTNANLSGAPLIVRDDPAVNFDWNVGSPASGIPADYFSARWTRTIDLAAGLYRFKVLADDGVRLWVDGGLLLDEWHAATASYVKDITLSGGSHSLRIEYFENTGQARITVQWERLQTTTDAYRGEYYNNENLFGSAVVQRDDAVIDFIWASAGPDPRINLASFSARWTGTPSMARGTWRLNVESNDGVRVWINGVLMVDAWRPGPLATQADFDVATSGPQDLRVEYFHHSGSAYVHAWWTLQRGPQPH